MTVSMRSLAEAFAAVVGKDGVTDDPTRLAAAAVDGHTPRWIITPGSLEQLGQVVALAADEGLAVMARGGGHALELGGPLARVDVVLDTAELDQILEYKPDDLTVTVQAGVSLAWLASNLKVRRQFLPLDPPAGTARTIGGVVASNASGPLRCRYGTLRDLLLGVRFVQADGVVTWGGAKVVKSVTGYDVPKLMVGSLGTLGVLGELTLRLYPLPDADRTWLATFTSAAAAQEFVAAVLDSTVQPSRFELVGRHVLEQCGVGAAAGVAISFGSVPAAAEAQGEVLRVKARATQGEMRPSPEGWWTAYDAALSGGAVALRIAVPVSRLGATVTEIERVVVAGEAGAPPAVGGCAAVGSLLVTTEGEVGALAGVIGKLREFVGPLGGHVMIARGPRALRVAIDPWGPIDPAQLALMRRLKDEFDPKRILSPGRSVGGL